MAEKENLAAELYRRHALYKEQIIESTERYRKRLEVKLTFVETKSLSRVEKNRKNLKISGEKLIFYRKFCI